MESADLVGPGERMIVQHNDHLGEKQYHQPSWHASLWNEHTAAAIK